MSPLTKLFIYVVIAADLVALVVFGGRYILDGSLLAHAAPAPIVVAEAQTDSAGSAGPAAEAAPAFDYATYVANADNGAKIAGKCKACHTFDNGGANRTGPNLWHVVGGPVMHKEDFAYSAAMEAYKGSHGTWSEENLMAFLENPRGTVEGTKMQFNGVKSPADRADLIAWLKTLQ